MYHLVSLIITRYLWRESAPVHALRDSALAVALWLERSIRVSQYVVESLHVRVVVARLYVHVVT